jgi:hypothetical protein
VFKKDEAKPKSEGRVAMKMTGTALAVVFVGLVLAAGTRYSISDPAVAAKSRGDGFAVSDAPNCGILPSPLNEKYVIREGDSFIIAVEADCPPGAPNDAEFEFVGEHPRFVTFTFPYRGPRSALSVLLIAPRAGDAGDYRITFDVPFCTGGFSCGRQSFRLKVKRAL